MWAMWLRAMRAWRRDCLTCLQNGSQETESRGRVYQLSVAAVKLQQNYTPSGIYNKEHLFVPQSMLAGSGADGSWAQQGLLMCLVSYGLSVALWILAGLSHMSGTSAGTSGPTRERRRERGREREIEEGNSRPLKVKAWDWPAFAFPSSYWSSYKPSPDSGENRFCLLMGGTVKWHCG